VLGVGLYFVFCFNFASRCCDDHVVNNTLSHVRLLVHPANKDSGVWSRQLRQRGTVVLEQSQPSTEVVLSPH